MSNIRVNSITDRLGTGSPDFPNGITIDTVTVSGKIVHTGDTDTSIGFPINDTITMDTAGTERLRIDSAGATLQMRPSDPRNEGPAQVADGFVRFNRHGTVEGLPMSGVAGELSAGRPREKDRRGGRHQS